MGCVGSSSMCTLRSGPSAIALACNVSASRDVLPGPCLHPVGEGAERGQHLGRGEGAMERPLGEGLTQQAAIAGAAARSRRRHFPVRRRPAGRRGVQGEHRVETSPVKVLNSANFARAAGSAAMRSALASAARSLFKFSPACSYSACTSSLALE